MEAGRASAPRLAEELAACAQSPLVSAFLESSLMMLAILNEHRQIVALNTNYLRTLGVADAQVVLGLRPGEAADCAHAKEGPDGCGTGPACPSCGLAIALLIASHRGRPAERDCYLVIEREGLRSDHDFKVRAAPLSLESQKFLLVSLQDVTATKRREQLDRVFLHDLANIAVGLDGASALLVRAGGTGAALLDVRDLSNRLVRELQVRRLLDGGEPGRFPASFEAVELEAITSALRSAIAHHPAAGGKTLELPTPLPRILLRTEFTLLQHVLVNMVVNAMEATPAGGFVRVTIGLLPDQVAFRVWNPGAIPAVVVPRIFQRYFTTKGGPGRGNGTYAMKLFGETYLCGRLSFSSSAADGTCFELLLPTDPTQGSGPSARR